MLFMSDVSITFKGEFGRVFSSLITQSFLLRLMMSNIIIIIILYTIYIIAGSCNYTIIATYFCILFLSILFFCLFCLYNEHCWVVHGSRQDEGSTVAERIYAKLHLTRV